MNNLLVLIKKEILEQVRTKKFLIICAVFLFIAISSPILAKLMPLVFKSVEIPGIVFALPDPTYIDAIDQYVKNISQLGIFVIIFLVAGAIAEEKSHKTLEMVLTKPISRESFILSKFLSYFFVLSSVFIVCSLLFYFYTISTFSSFSFVNFVIISGNILLYILMIVAVTLLASSFMRNTVLAAGIGFLFMIILSSGLTLIKSIKDYLPTVILGNYKEVLMNGFNNDLIKPIIVTIGIIGIAIIFSLISFKRQEIEK